MKIKKYFPGAIGSGLGTAIYEGYRHGLQGIDWYKVVFIALITLAILTIGSLVTEKRDEGPWPPGQ